MLPTVEGTPLRAIGSAVRGNIGRSPVDVGHPDQHSAREFKIHGSTADEEVYSSPMSSLTEREPPMARSDGQDRRLTRKLDDFLGDPIVSVDRPASSSGFASDVENPSQHVPNLAPAAAVIHQPAARRQRAEKPKDLLSQPDQQPLPSTNPPTLWRTILSRPAWTGDTLIQVDSTSGLRMINDFDRRSESNGESYSWFRLCHSRYSSRSRLCPGHSRVRNTIRG